MFGVDTTLFNGSGLVQATDPGVFKWLGLERIECSQVFASYLE